LPPGSAHAETKLERRQADARGITKQGNRYIRKLLVLGATSLLNVVGKRKGALRDWIIGLLAKKPARLVTVARKQAGPDSLGDDEDRRMLLQRDVCKGVSEGSDTPPQGAFTGEEICRFEFGKGNET